MYGVWQVILEGAVMTFILMSTRAWKIGQAEGFSIGSLVLHEATRLLRPLKCMSAYHYDALSIFLAVVVSQL